MAQQVSESMLEDVKNETILPYIEENIEFPCLYQFWGIGNWSDASDADEIATSLVSWMTHNNWKSARKATDELESMRYIPYSESGATTALLAAYGAEYADECGVINMLDDLDYRGVDYWIETYDNNSDVIEVIDTSDDIEGELPVINRLLDYDVDGFYSAMDAWRAGTPIEDIIV